MKFKFYDVVIINFPFSDLSVTKRRPALVLNNEFGEDLILCQITTKKNNFSNQIFISKEEKLLNLKIDSFVCPWKIFTLNKNLILGKIGNLSQEKIKLIKKELISIFKI